MWKRRMIRSNFLYSCKRQIHQLDIKLSNERYGLKISSGKYAKFADGSAVVTAGDTSVMMTAVSKNKSGISSFVPLTVDYRQKAAAAGRIPTNFLKRELGPTDKEILTGRMIDRSIRPLFPKGFHFETQCVCNLMSVDGINSPDILAINAASAALAISDIPWNGPVGAVRVGCLPKSGEFITNPTRKQIMDSDLNLVIAGTQDKLTVMIEAEANNIDKIKFLDAIKFGLEDCSKIATKISQWSQKVGRPKCELQPLMTNDSFLQIKKDTELLCCNKLRSIYHTKTHDKTSRDKAMFSVMDSALISLKETYPHLNQEVFSGIFNEVNRNVIKDLIFEDKQRVDGRDFDQLREISCEVNLYSPLHGSALFQRGQTQVFCTVVLDSLESTLKADPMSELTGAIKEKNFFLHYEFPPYATNDIGRTSSGRGRRELGHGALAEKSLRPVIPENYPFTIRLTSEVLESNGSSSMATVCGGSLALLDAGVQISSPVAGVAVGLITHKEDYRVLLDILGQEDFAGDMDFKLAGTETGITALQADIKIPGLTFNMVKDATLTGHDGILKILNIMNTCISSPRIDKDNLPVTETISVPLNKRHKFIGPAGLNLRRITSQTGVQINSGTSEGSWILFATNSEAMEEAKELIEESLKDDVDIDLTFGAIYTVTVLDIQSSGINVQIHPGLPSVFIHNSQLTAQKISHPSVANIHIGQELQVKNYGRDPVTGAIRLSRKALLVARSAALNAMPKTTIKS